MTQTYRARLITTPDEFIARWAALDPGATPFQSPHWLGAWYRHVGSSEGISPVLVEIEDVETNEPVMGLPLVLDRRSRQSVIGFADLGISDYNMPLLGPAAPTSIAGAAAAWAAAREVLPQADLSVFEKMPQGINGRANPIVLALGGHRSHLSGGQVILDEEYDAWLRGLPRHDRKELGRFWRVFTAHSEDARFIRARNAGEGRAILDWLEAMQNARSEEVGYEYLLDRPAYRDLYRALAEGGIERGEIIITALKAGEEFVAALYCIASKPRYTMVRIATAGGDWSNCSPGRLIIERTMATLHAEGYRHIDFGIGDYAYKRRFHLESIPLFDVTLALSMFGLPRKAIQEAKAYVKSRPALEQVARRAMAWRRGKAA